MSESKYYDKNEDSTGADNEAGNDFFKVVENYEIMRLQLFFEDTPDENTRTVLKRHGFRWSPKNRCWQRNLTTNAKVALHRVLEELKKTETIED